MEPQKTHSFTRHYIEADRWYTRARQQLESVNRRITALDGKLYPGCGFHHEMHSEVAVLRRHLRSDNPEQRELWFSTVMSVRLEALIRSVVEAEEYIKTQRALAIYANKEVL